MPAEYYNVQGTVETTEIELNIATSGDNLIIAAPGERRRIVICDIQLMNNTATGSTVLLKSGSTIFRRFLFQNQGNGIAVVLSTYREWRLGKNEALNINLSGALSHVGGLSYFIEIC